MTRATTEPAPPSSGVFFDDFKVTITSTAVVQSSEYYPFGLLTSNSWTRDNAVTNNFLFDAGNELNSTTGFYDLPYRNYDASLGRFFQVDPLSHTSHTMTPYHYAGNNPIGFNDPTGLFMNAKYSPGDGNHNGTPDWAEERNADVDALYGYGGGGGGGGGGSGGGAYESEYYDAALVNGGWMTQEEYAAKWGATYSAGDGESFGFNSDGVFGVWLSTDAQVGVGDPINFSFTVIAIRDRFVPLASLQPQASSSGDGGSWLNMFSLQVEVSGGVQGGLNLNHMAQANLNLASTPLFSLSLGRENKIDYLERHKDGITIKQSASLGLAGFSGAWEREFLGKSFGNEPPTDKYTVTVPIPIPGLFGVLNVFNETIVGPDGKTTNQGGLTIDFSGGIIINGSIGLKYYGD